MQKAVFAITIPHFFPHLYLHSPQKAYHESSIQSLILRFNVHGTFQINQSNFLISRIILTFYLVSVAESLNAQKCHSELVSESIYIKMLRDPETSSG